jgi:DHA2 family multidrug resistance protein
MITASIMLATIMHGLDMTIANVALPHIQGSVQAAQAQITWVLTSYMVASAIALPVTGWLCSQWGRRNVFIIAVMGFTAASALCGLSDSLSTIVAARLLQGMFGAALVPLSQAVLLDINPPHKVGQAMAIWGAGTMLGPILGPVLGGWLTEEFGWRWVFFVNVPVGALALWGIGRYLPEDKAAGTPLDVFGFVTLSIAIGSLQLFLDRGELLDWFDSPEIRIEAVLGAAALAFFIAHTATVRGPSFLNRELVKDRNLVAGLVVGFVIGIVIYATSSMMPTFLQTLLGYPVVDAGKLMLPRTLGVTLSIIVAGRLVSQVDPRVIIACGLSVTAFAQWQMTQFTLQMDTAPIIVSGFIHGAGTGCTFVALASVTFATLAPALRNEATPLYNLVRNVGGSVGISIMQVLLTRNSAQAHEQVAQLVTRANPGLQSLPPVMDPGSVAGLALLNEEVTRQAAMIGYLANFGVLMALTVMAIPLVLLIRSPRDRGRVPVAEGAQ